MSLWWASRDQLDETQVALIEELPLRGDYLILGPPGSGKTNVLLRRAQFVRSQQMPNVLVLTFTRSLTEFVKTGCYDSQGREIFPRTLVSTLESWIRSLYVLHKTGLPAPDPNLSRWKSTLAGGALEFAAENRIPTYDALFVDEAQDLMPEEVALLKAWSPNLFFVGDDRQKIYSHSEGLNAVRTLSPVPIERFLPFHYRMAPEICEMADRIQVAEGGRALSATSHYKGPQPGRIRVHGPLTRHEQIERAGEALHDQLRVYAGLIEQGDRLAVVVPRQDDRDLVLDTLEENASLVGKSKIIRARSGEVEDREYDPSFNRDQPIAILTEQGSKGLEFRAVHWLFCDEAHWRKAETYYTVVTRAKTRLDIYHGSDLPGMLAKAYSPPAGDLW